SFWVLGMPDWSLPQFVDKARVLGYGGIDLRVAPDGHLAPDASTEDLAAVKSAFASSGVELASLLCYNRRGNGRDPVDWTAVEQDMVDLAHLSARLDGRLLRITVGTPDPEAGWGTYLSNLGSAMLTALKEVPD